MSDRRSNPVDCAAMTTRTMSIVLPAFNEAERIGPALDELFGYLNRRAAHPRAMAHRARQTSRRYRRPGRRRRRLRRHRGSGPCPAGDRDAQAGVPVDPPRAARRQGRRGAGGDARARRRSRHLRRRRHGDAARPARPLLVEALRRTTSRSAAGSSRTARTCARASRATGGCSARRSTCSPRSGSSARSRTPSAASRASRRDAAQDLFARQKDHQHRLRRRADLPGPAARLRYRDRADPLGGPPRLADAGPAQPRRTGRVGPVPDPAPPSPRRPARRVRVTRGATCVPMTEPRGSALATIVRVLPIVAIVTFVVVVGAVARAAGPLLGYNFQAYVHAAQRLLDGGRLYDPAVNVAGGFAIYLYPPPFAVAFIPFALLPDGMGVGLWTVLLGAAVVGAALLMPVRREIRWLVVLLAAFDWPVLSLDQAGPGRPDPAAAVARSAGAGWIARRCWRRRSSPAASRSSRPLALAGWALLPAVSGPRPIVAGAIVALGVASLVVLGPSTVGDYVGLLARVSAPVTTPHNFTPGAVAFQAGASEAVASAIQLATCRLRGRCRPRRDPLRRRRGVVPGRGRRHAARVAASLGPLRGAAPAAGRLAAQSRPVVGRVAAARNRAAGARDRAGGGLPDRVRDLPRRADRRLADVGRRQPLPPAGSWSRRHEEPDDVDPDRSRDSLVLIGIIAAVVYWVVSHEDRRRAGRRPRLLGFQFGEPLRRHPEAGEKNGFNYSPIFDTLVAPGRLLPFEVFVAIWRAILLVALIYLAGPFTIFVLFTVPVASEINAGNIQILLALAIVKGFRWPATWSFVLLTKVTPGVGLLWFALRREWRALAIAFGFTPRSWPCRSSAGPAAGSTTSRSGRPSPRRPSRPTTSRSGSDCHSRSRSSCSGRGAATAGRSSSARRSHCPSTTSSARRCSSVCCRTCVRRSGGSSPSAARPRPRSTSSRHRPQGERVAGGRALRPARGRPVAPAVAAAHRPRRDRRGAARRRRSEPLGGPERRARLLARVAAAPPRPAALRPVGDDRHAVCLLVSAGPRPGPRAGRGRAAIGRVHGGVDRAAPRLHLVPRRPDAAGRPRAHRVPAGRGRALVPEHPSRAGRDGRPGAAPLAGAVRSGVRRSSSRRVWGSSTSPLGGGGGTPVWRRRSASPSSL